MSHYCTKDGRRVSIFTPISRKDLTDIPDAETWRSRDDFIDEVAYRDLQRLIMEAFAFESDDYSLGFVSGFHSAIDTIREALQQEESFEAVWNQLMLLLSEAAKYVPPSKAADETEYLRIPTPDPDSLPN